MLAFIRRWPYLEHITLSQQGLEWLRSQVVVQGSESALQRLSVGGIPIMVSPDVPNDEVRFRSVFFDRDGQMRYLVTKTLKIGGK